MEEHKKPYIVMPLEGFRSGALSKGALQSVGSGISISRRTSHQDGRPNKINVIDAIPGDGPRLVEMTDDAYLDLKLDYNVRIIPLVYYTKPDPIINALKQVQDILRLTQKKDYAEVTVVDESGRPIPGAQVLAFTHFQSRTGEDAVTDRRGKAFLNIKPGTKIERLYALPAHSHWSRVVTAMVLQKTNTVQVSAIDLTSASLALDRFCGHLPLDAGSGVRVAVIDTGVDGNHEALTHAIDGGANMVLSEIMNNPGAHDDWRPCQTDGTHGTHVAGVIAAKPIGASKIRGVAPGAEIVSYRVFPDSGEGATNFDIAKAIDRAVANECKIINLSLGGAAQDELVRMAIRDAVQRGCLVVAAAGNDGRSPVCYPAAFPGVVGVSAYGDKTTFPSHSAAAFQAAKPYAADKPHIFLAAFSNVGPQIDCMGPGVGVVSTVPGNAYAAMDGTSMAAPAIAGWAAYLLSRSRSEVENRPLIDQSSYLYTLLMSDCRVSGMGLWNEGYGIPSAGSSPVLARVTSRKRVPAAIKPKASATAGTRNRPKASRKPKAST